MRTRILLSPFLLFSILVSVCGQQPGPPPSPTPQRPAASPTITQADDDQDVVRITTNLVQVDAVVTKDGKVVTDLTADEFEIFEDGRPQTITNFSYVSNVPDNAAAKVAPSRSSDKNAAPVLPAIIRPQDPRRTIAIVFDDLGMSFESLARAKNQIRKFIEELPPNDLVAIIRTGGQAGALQQFTTDRRLLQSAVERLRWNYCSRAGVHTFPMLGGTNEDSDNSGLCSQRTARRTYLTLRFIVNGMRDLPGRKSMVVLSDSLPINYIEPQPGSLTAQTVPSASTGGDLISNFTNYESLAEMVAEHAIRASVVIYAADTRGLLYTGLAAADPNPRPGEGGPGAVQIQHNALTRNRTDALLQGRDGAELMTSRTGGLMVYNSNDFRLQQVADDQQGYYLIGFRPHEETFDRKFHKLKARVKRKGVSVRTRAGFFGFSEAEARPKELSSVDEMAKALMSPFGASDLTMRLTTFFVDEGSRGQVLRSFVYLKPDELTFKEESDGSRVAVLQLRSVLFGDNGRVFADQKDTGGLRLDRTGYDQAIREGLVYSFDLPAKDRGVFQMRVAVRDPISSRIGAAGQFVEIPDLRNGRLALSGIVVRQDATAGGISGRERLDTIGPARRKFHQGAALVFTYGIYNAARETTMPSQLTTQTRLFRDGKLVFTGEAVAVGLDGQSDPRRIMGVSTLRLDSKIEPGEYIALIVVTEGSSPKARRASQWIDFEVFK